MDKRFLIIMVVVAGLLATGLILQDSSKKKDSPLNLFDKINTTPTPAVGMKAEFITPSKVPSPIPTKPLEASPSAMETLEGGLMIGEIKEGIGKIVKTGDTVQVNYTGALEDGTKFDSSYDKGQPFVTQIGAGMVIKGWDIGVVGMKEGGIRRLVIPPELGYGAAGAGNGAIPPNATLIFDIEVLKIK
ncbi:MAG: peptidylprolyl isomerase [Candidatus Levybacteria bacterium CG_4_9_14_3_um_filter_35_16]|nr:MAG: peptidylprolyl isomerase [Candidatus Levybacteria bacterium CG22_combo_CG10-13_8_21_14_all_35_11]PJA90985.1 MAG: peptidylprolyl isomerase [Candidatus Levybacteria bacterium CG_4_9_14_3_um_filter_35_16]PJC53987.1 MAG: peptidylprolyl isomerase [Candidatus Levybacteria bacterium CG_4_9_14_0_2_um_filter_35_21]